MYEYVYSQSWLYVTKWVINQTPMDAVSRESVVVLLVAVHVIPGIPLEKNSRNGGTKLEIQEWFQNFDKDTCNYLVYTECLGIRRLQTWEPTARSSMRPLSRQAS